MQNIALILLVSVLYCKKERATAADTLWPIPQHISGSGGPFPVSPTFSILSSSKSEVLERGITRYLEIITRDISLPDQTNEVPHSSGESLELLQVNVASDNESLSLKTSYRYNLTVTAGKAQINAASPYGALYGLETFSQLVVKGSLVYSEVRITDYPDYVHRGLMLDTGRRIFPIELLYNIMDAMSYIKMNVLHFHLSDLCRFSVESKLYPDLRNNEKQIYTQADVQKIVDYARDRGIRVIPEVETGGHANGLIGLANKPNGLKFCEPPNRYLMLYNDPENVTVTTMKNILKEMAGLFPDGFFHLGMDETSEAEECTRQNTKSLEIELLQYVQSLGRTPFTWEEALLSTQAVTKGTVIQAWASASIKGIIAQGFRAVNSLSSNFYLNYLNIEASGLWTDIALGLNAEEKKMLLGGEMPMWTDEYCYKHECINDQIPSAGWMYYGPKYDPQFTESVSSVIWPRGIVGAGSFWNYQSELDSKSDEFKLRYRQQQLRFMERGVMTCPIGCTCDYNNKCGQPYPRE